MFRLMKLTENEKSNLKIGKTNACKNKNLKLPLTIEENADDQKK